jgi:hypothetical protein
MGCRARERKKSSIELLVIVIRLEAKGTFYAGGMLLFFLLKKDALSSENLTVHPISISGATTLSGPWPPSEDASILLRLLIVSSKDHLAVFF